MDLPICTSQAGRGGTYGTRSANVTYDILRPLSFTGFISIFLQKFTRVKKVWTKVATLYDFEDNCSTYPYVILMESLKAQY